LSTLRSLETETAKIKDQSSTVSSLRTEIANIRDQKSTWGSLETETAKIICISVLNPQIPHWKDTEKKYRKFETYFKKRKLCSYSPNSYIHVSVSDLYIYSPDGSAYSAAGK
jgi:hypothetical protein